MRDRVQQLADDVFPEVVRLRRQIHRHPELAFDEHRTARLVKDTLDSLENVTLRTSVAGTGIVATLTGEKDGPASLLRADMDALPITEDTGRDFASENEGAMHACGHDAHTASLLGAAMVLSKMRDRLAGTVRLLFQPSEEKLPGGAKAMIEDGALASHDHGPAPGAVFGQHVAPDLESGHIGVRSEMYMASADEIYVRVQAEGGHAAAPHELEGDAVVAAAHVVTALQSIVSRHGLPGTPSVLTIGHVETPGGATNVIPETVRLEGTFRTMDEDWRARAHALIERVAARTAEAHGATAEAQVVAGYPALYNHPGEAEFVREAACDYVGPERTADLDRWYAGEDFAYYLQERPGAFYRLGTRGDDPATAHGLHTARFDIDEEALRAGAGFMAFLALRYGNARR
jgi:hippurate hydrolase